MTIAALTLAVSLVKEFEGLRLSVYRCPAGLWTVGYGHTGPDVYPGQTITAEQAEILLLKDLKVADDAVTRRVKVALTDPQRAALISFIFNLGESKFAGSTLLKKVNAGDYAAVPAQLALWIHALGKPLPGLVRRRAAESEMWTRQ
jgi:lysozyme